MGQSQSTDLIKCHIYPEHLMEIYGHIDTCNKLYNCDRYIFELVGLESWYIAYTICNNKKKTSFVSP